MYVLTMAKTFTNCFVLLNFYAGKWFLVPYSKSLYTLILFLRKLPDCTLDSSSRDLCEHLSKHTAWVAVLHIWLGWQFEMIHHGMYSMENLTTLFAYCNDTFWFKTAITNFSEIINGSVFILVIYIVSYNKINFLFDTSAISPLPCLFIIHCQW